MHTPGSHIAAAKCNTGMPPNVSAFGLLPLFSNSQTLHHEQNRLYLLTSPIVLINFFFDSMRLLYN
jgi:hypothetical protein